MRFIVIVAALAIAAAAAQDLPDINLDPFIFETTTLPENLRFMPSVGNGHLATVINTDTLYVNGLYNGRLGWSHRARVPPVHASNISVDPEPDHRSYKLDIRQGEYREEITLTDYYNIEYRVYAHQYFNRLMVTEVRIQRTGNTNQQITIDRNSLTGNMSSIDVGFDQTLDVEDEEICPNTTAFGCYYRHGQTVVPETDASGQIDVHTYWGEFPDILTLPPGRITERWTFLFSVDQVQQVAEDNFKMGMEYVKQQDSQGLLDVHRVEWAKIWDMGHIQLEGSNLELQKVVYGCFYYIYSFLPAVNTSSPNNQFGGLSPGGLANGANWTDYQGHVFWDMETWMYPGILMFRPDLAREMLSYRVHGMDPAFERATSGGYQGVRFPWESGFTGTEVTPDICVPCRENQQHITGDISLAARQYVFATRDRNWLNEKQAPLYNDYTGLDLIHNMGKFWYSRPTFNFEKSKFEVNGVMPPDEFAQYINNSVYTNAGAMLAINLAKYASCLAGKEHNDVEYEVPDRWLNVARNLVFMFDSDERYHPEYEGYMYRMYNDTAVENGMVKQADVVMLNFPYMMDIPADVKRKDMEVYERLTDPGGPAMTWGIYGISWLELDEEDSESNAQRLLNKSYQLYMREPFKIWTEAQSGLGAINFLTGMGGFLQTILFGYGGLRIHPEELKFYKPNLPEGITKMSFKNFDYLGAKLDITVDDFNVNVKLLEEGPYPITLTHSDTTTDLSADASVSFPRGEYQMYTKEPSGCSAPEDYIEVDYSSPVQPAITTDSDTDATLSSSQCPPTTTQKPCDCPPSSSVAAFLTAGLAEVLVMIGVISKSIQYII